MAHEGDTDALKAWASTAGEIEKAIDGLAEEDLVQQVQHASEHLRVVAKTRAAHGR